MSGIMTNGGVIERNPLASHESGLKICIGWCESHLVMDGPVVKQWVGSNGLQFLSAEGNVYSFRVLDQLSMKATHATPWLDPVTGAALPLNDMSRLQQGAGYTMQVFAGSAPRVAAAEGFLTNLTVSQPVYQASPDPGWYFNVKTYRSAVALGPLTPVMDAFYLKVIYSTLNNKGLS